MIKLVPGLFHNEDQTKEDLCNFIKKTDQLSIGQQCAKFEQSFASYQERKHCVLFSSGSSANLALIQALLNLQLLLPDQQVAFSAITWATNVMPLIQLGTQPVPVDVELETLNVSSSSFSTTLEKNPDIKMLFLTNLLGFCSDLNNIQRICAERNILLIEDNCEALGTEYQGRKLGNWGLASTFSFFVGHHMSTIEGGAVVTNNPALHRMLRLVRAHGWDRNLSNEEKDEIRQEFNVDDTFFANFTFYNLGYNLRPTEITGFLGSNQLKYLPNTIKKRHANWQDINRSMASNPDFLHLSTSHIDLVSNFAIPVICQNEELTHQYIDAFKAADVEIRPILGGSIPEQPFYIKTYGHSDAITNARLIDKQGFYFGNNPDLSQSQMDTLHSLCRGEKVFGQKKTEQIAISS